MLASTKNPLNNCPQARGTLTGLSPLIGYPQIWFGYCTNIITQVVSPHVTFSFYVSSSFSFVASWVDPRPELSSSIRLVLEPSSRQLRHVGTHTILQLLPSHAPRIFRIPVWIRVYT